MSEQRASHILPIMDNQTRPDSTDRDAPSVSRLPEGLTAQQERAAALLITGKGILEVARELGVHRSTLWNWQRLPTFEAYRNVLLTEIKENTRAGMLSMYDEALLTVRRLLTSENETAAFKAAAYVIERVEGAKPGATDAREVIRKECATNGMDELLKQLDGEERLDEVKYRRRCKEIGIEP